MNTENKNEVEMILKFLLNDFDFGFPAFEERWAIKKALDSLEAQKDLLEACKECLDLMLAYENKLAPKTHETLKKIQQAITKAEA